MGPDHRRGEPGGGGRDVQGDHDHDMHTVSVICVYLVMYNCDKIRVCRD